MSAFYRRPNFKAQKLIVLIGSIFFIIFFGLISIGMVASHQPLQVVWVSLAILIIVPPIMLIGDALFQGPEFISLDEKGLTLVYTGARGSELRVAWASIHRCVPFGKYVYIEYRATPFGRVRHDVHVEPAVFAQMKSFIDVIKIAGQKSS